MGKKWLIVGLIVVAAGAEGTALWLDRNDNGKKAAVVSAVAADTGAVTVSVAATGTVQAATSRSLSFTVDGTVTKVAVLAGSKVKAGTVLATVDNADASDAVDDAQDTLDDAVGQLDDAEDAVSKSAAGGGSKSAAAGGTSATAAGGSKSTATGGSKASAASRADDDDSVSSTVAAAAEQRGTTGLDAVFTAQERVNQARAALAEAKIALAGTTITAPIAGTIMTVAGQVGSQVSKGSTFVTLADTYTMQVSASFPEADAGSLATGQSATVTLADRVGDEFAAKVAQVDPVGTSDGTLVTYGVLLSFTQQPADLLVGQSASVEVHTGEVASTLRVPSTAVHDVSATQGTVLVRAAGRSTQREVEVGLRGDQYTQITKGLTAGETVVRSW
jgi:multidrug efflux pump subunit AcrA (membrane-fusion protein)